MSELPTPTQFASPPVSPCIRVCTLDDERNCMGCGRHLDEIVAWSRMSAAEQWAVCERSAQRRARNGYPGDAGPNFTNLR